MQAPQLIGMHVLSARAGRVTVLLFQHHSGRVSGQCLLEGDERPIIDGETVDGVLASIEGVLEEILLARRIARS
jgi:hypothetical protein